MQYKLKKMVGLIALTLVLGAVIAFLLHTSKDVHWGGGFWENWLQGHWHLTPEQAHQLVFGFRKTMHFMGYGCLTLLFWGYFSLWGLRRYPAFWGLAATAAVAAFDEYNQALSSFRSGKPTDVLLDCCGGLVFVLVATWFLPKFRPKGNKE